MVRILNSVGEAARNLNWVGGGGGWEEVGIELGWGDGGKFELGGEMLENLNWVGEDGGEFELGGYWGLEMVGLKNL